MRINIYLKSIYFFFVFVACSATQSLFAQTDDNFILRENFNRADFGNLWQAHPSWSVKDGYAFNSIDGTGGTLKTAKSYKEKSYVIVTTAKGFTESYYREFSITFGQNNLSKDGMYKLRYTAEGGGRLTLYRTTGNLNPAQVLDELAMFPAFNSFDWYTFKIAKYKSGLIQVYVNKGSGYSKIPLLETIDSTYSELGHIGWQVDTQTSAEDFYVDWMIVNKPYLEKPAIKEKPAEDDLITQVSDNTGKSYNVAKLNPGVKQYSDWDYSITYVPEYLKGASFIQTANDDKLNKADSFLTFFIKTSAIVYIAYDPRSKEKPEWLSQWTKTGDQIKTSDQNAGYLDVYSRFVEYAGELYPHPIILGGNLAGSALGAKTNYLVAAIKPPKSKNLQAEDAKLSGAVAANDHLQFNGTGFADFKNLTQDYIEWKVNIDVPGTYNLIFRFANAGSADRFLQITDNGIEVGTADFNVISTSWSTWASLVGPNVFLTSGVHKIRVTASGTSGPNIDELSISYSSSSVPVLSESYVSIQKVSDQLHDISVGAYPNPFLQSTKIYYEVKEKTKVSLNIYTLQGQLVQLLENSVHLPGKHQAEFDASKYAKGIYVYRLQIGNTVKAGRLIKE